MADVVVERFYMTSFLMTGDHGRGLHQAARAFGCIACAECQCHCMHEYKHK